MRHQAKVFIYKFIWLKKLRIVFETIFNEHSPFSLSLHNQKLATHEQSLLLIID